MTAEDRDAVSRIFAQGIALGTATFRDAVPSWEEFDAGHLSFCRLVICDEGKVAGWCALSPVSSRDCYMGVAEVSIYVDEEVRGKGFGTLLLNRLCDEAKAHGIWSLLAVVLANNKASLALHRKCGFREIGYRERIAQDIFGEWQNTVMFEKRL
ncbi:MAG TPA: GNAT family N-acetyltransferase [Methanocorpusculum sp.]|nr:GNAT family N-acetyltransferase [Methanocorpusculum sp.]